MTPADRPFGRADVPAPTGEEAGVWDARARDEAGIPERVLMENAGRSAALVLDRLHPRGPVVAVVGSGNNGGDALVLLRTLAAWGREVAAVTVSDTDHSALLHGRSLRIVEDSARAATGLLSGAAVVVDGILGTGIRGAPRERQAEAIRRVNGAGRPVLAIDLPSGVDADTGAVPGEAVRADVTVAFGGPKLGTLLHPGRERAGRLVAVETAFPPPADGEIGQWLITPGWARSRQPRRSPETHKNAVGSLLVLAGSEGMAGAAVLAARAALRAGAGLVRIASAAANREILQTAVPEAIFLDRADPGALRDAAEASDAVAAGPGLGTDEAAATALAVVLEAAPDLPTVLDADALNLVAEGAAPSLPDLASARPLLLTPHPGEMERISGRPREEVLGDRPGAARRLAGRSGAAVLLKGIPSLVAAPDGGIRVDTGATSDLATGGMGDVLTGVAGSLVAQGTGAAEAGALALFFTGRAASRSVRGPGLLPEDVVAMLPEVLSEEGEGESDLELPFVLFDQDAAR